MKKLNKENTGAKIAELRDAAGLTQKELSTELGVTSQYLGRIERGQRNAPKELLIAASVFFDVSLDYLVFGEKRRPCCCRCNRPPAIPSLYDPTARRAQ